MFALILLALSALLVQPEERVCSMSLQVILSVLHVVGYSLCGVKQCDGFTALNGPGGVCTFAAIYLNLH